MTFVTFEGPEGAGKSTQIKLLADRLQTHGYEVLLTREPGGAPEAEALRSLLLDPARRWSAEAEALLMYAARDAHIRTAIEPALSRGEVVLCDRFHDSTEAYQLSIDSGLLAALKASIVKRLPDLTILFDLPVELGLERAAGRGRADRFEVKGIDYHRQVRARFLEIAAREPRRVVVINASLPMQDVTKSVLSAVRARLPGLLGEDDGASSPA
ncbi:MAG: dTMP kinase [Parvularcula sp.]|nr:dTMP kinase [Parvularcula sp.]